MSALDMALAFAREPAQAARRAGATLRGAARALRGADLWPGPPRPADTPRLLVVANYDPAGSRALVDSLDAFRRLSRFQVDVVNIRYAYHCWRRYLPPDFPLHDYDAVMVHFTTSFRPKYLRDYHRDLRQSLADFPGLKVVQMQDEQVRTDERKAAILADGYDVITTCVPPDQLERVYPAAEFGAVKIHPMLTGYVHDAMLAQRFPVDGPRPIDLSYRGNRLAFHHGRLPYEKYARAEALRPLCAAAGLNHDLSSEWYHRVYGPRWYGLLGRSKGVLGLESGVTCFDFDGSIERNSEAYLRENPGAGFEEVHARFLAPHEGNVDYRQVSPRHFEAIACRAVQVLYEGRYSGLLEPGRHYLSLAWDHSNLAEVFDALRDPARRRQITEAAYDEVLRRPDLQYPHAIGELDTLLGAPDAGGGRSPGDGGGP